VSSELDRSTESFGVQVVKTPSRCPMANGICERVLGTIRGECLHWLIPVSEGYLCRVLKSWIGHYNRGRLHGLRPRRAHSSHFPAEVNTEVSS
jgi:putative transposase